MSIWQRRVLCVLLATGGLAAPARAHADPPAAATNEARERFSQGLKLFEKGDNAAALAEFRRAYELVPNPLVLYNIGLVFAAMNRPVESVDALEKFLGEGGAATAGEPGRHARRVRDEQAARVAKLVVLTNKPATIEIDGIEAGKTPLAQPLRVPSGAHVVSAQAAGYLPSRQAVMLAGKVTETVTLALLPAETTSAHLTLTVSVPGAEVLVDGKPVGTTPLPASIAVTPGAATIEVRRSGYRAASRSVTLDEGATGALTVSLEEDPATPATMKGLLRVRTDEADAALEVDGTSKPLVSEGLPLVAGPHVIRVERTGFVPFERPIMITAGQETSLAVTLTPTGETTLRYETRAHARRVWGWSAFGAGVLVTAGAVVYAVVTRHDVGTAQTNLDAQLTKEMTPTDHCSTTDPNSYMAYHCGEQKSYLQDQISSAKLRRDAAYGLAGLGVVGMGVGTYLLLTASSAEATHAPLSGVSLFFDGHSGGITTGFRF